MQHLRRTLCSALFSKRKFNITSHVCLFTLQHTRTTPTPAPGHYFLWETQILQQSSDACGSRNHTYCIFTRTHAHYHATVENKSNPGSGFYMSCQAMWFSWVLICFSFTESFYRDSFLCTLRLWLSRENALHSMQLTGESLFWNQQHCSWLWHFVFDWEEAWT